MPHSTDHMEVDTGLACLATIARINGVTTDEAQLKHQFSVSGRPFDKLTLLRASKHLELKARQVKSSWSRLGKLHLPAIAKHKDGHYFIIAKVAGDTALIQDPLERRPLTLPRTLFEQFWSGELILLTHRAGVTGERRRFDFTWFIPAIIKYRRLLGEVLIASFFLQVFALVSPLFFQVIIDKVLVHRGLTTLDVLAFGLVTISVFEVVLGGLRTYLFSHTTNRIDVELGARLFRHLTALPLTYFTARRVGDSVARVRELESTGPWLGIYDTSKNAQVHHRHSGQNDKPDARDVGVGGGQDRQTEDYRVFPDPIAMLHARKRQGTLSVLYLQINSQRD